MKNIMGYEVVKKIGEGGYGKVYLVKKENAAGTFLRALKHISFPSETQYEEMMEAFQGNLSKTEQYFNDQLQKIVNEIRIQNKLSNEENAHIVKCYDNEVKKSEDPLHYDIYILMEYLTPLKNYIVEHSLSEEEVVRLGLQISDAIQLCHEHNILHRDIKEDNIFVSENQNFKLGDFGIAKYETRTNSLSWNMTMNYSSPEVITQQDSFSASDDVYSLGIVLYKLLNHGRYPFLPPFPEPYDEEDKERAIHSRIHYEEIPLPSDCPTKLGTIILKALKKKEERYKSAKEFKDALQKYADEKNYSAEKKNLSDYVNRPDDEKTSEISMPSARKKKAAEDTKNLFDLPKKAEVDPAPEHSAKRELFKYERTEEKHSPYLLWLIPALFLVLLLILVLFVVPALLNTAGSYLSYLFENYESLDFNGDVVPAYRTVIILKVLTYLFFGLFIASLFFAAKSLNQTNQKRNDVITGNIYDRLLTLKDLSLLQKCYADDHIQNLFDILIQKTRMNGELGIGNDEKSAIEMEIVGSIKRLDERLRERDQQSEVIKELKFIQRKLKERERASHHKR